MRPFRTKTIMANALSVLALARLTLGFTCVVCVASAGGAERSPTRGARDPQIDPTPIDSGEFALRYPGREYDEPGVIKYGGYCTGGAHMIRYSYRGETGDATVEVVEHPPTYPYVKHDFLGTFFHGFEEQKRKTDQGAREVVVPVEYIEWRTVEPAASHTICVLIIPSNGAYHGFAGWYTEPEGGITTVMLRFGTQGGLPRGVIDQYLKKYPSGIRGTVPSLESWQADDIAKWIALLQTRANEDVVLNVGSLHLHRYDPGEFGLQEAWNKRGDPAALTNAVNKSIGRMKAWLAEREAKKRDSGGRKRDGE